MTNPLNRTRRGPLLVLVLAFAALLVVPAVIATIGVDEERDAAGAAGTTTEVPTSVESSTTSELATTTTESAPTTTETTAVPVPETTTTTIDLAAVYTYAAALEKAKTTPTTTTPPAPVVQYVVVPAPVEAAAEPEPAPAPEPEPVVEVPADGDPFAGLSWSDRQFLECVKNRESGGNYGAVNPSSGAGGAYQFLRNTWNNTASHAGRGDLVGVAPQYASPYDQDFIAAHLLQWYGRSPWGYSC